jgi:hypothetical protein
VVRPQFYLTSPHKAPQRHYKKKPPKGGFRTGTSVPFPQKIIWLRQLFFLISF